MLIALNKKIISDKRGGVLIFIVLAMGMLITCIGVAIDMGRVFLVRSKAQTALDAAVVSVAAISTSNTSQAELQSRGQKYFDANFPDDYMGVASVTPTFQAVDNGASVRGELNFQMETLFGPLIDALLPQANAVSDVDLGVFSQVNRVMGDVTLEIALVLDTTTSMCFNSAGNYNASSCSANLGKYQALIDAVEVLVSTLDGALEATTSDDTKIFYSFIPFIHTVSVNGQADHDYVKDTPDWLLDIKGLSENGEAIVNKLKSKHPTDKGGTGTNTALGSYWGWLSLRQDSRSKFTGTSAHETSTNPVPLNTKGVYKMMILMTDGRNMFPWWEDLDGDGKDEFDPREDHAADADQERICEDMHAEDIEIRVVPFLVDDQETKDRLKNKCASKDEYYYEVNTVDGLKDAFEEIANDLIDLRITR